MPSGMLAASQADRAREQASQMHQKGDFQGGFRLLWGRAEAARGAGLPLPERDVSGLRPCMGMPLAGQGGYGLRTSMSEK